MTITVLVAEDEEPLRAAITALVDGEPELAVVAAAAAADEAIELARATSPRVALVDVRMPGGGPAAARGIREHSPRTRILALSAYDDMATVLGMLRAGAVGYLVKGTSPVEVIEAIRRADRGQASLSIDVIDRVLSEALADLDERRDAEEALHRSEQRFRSLLESSPDAVVIVDERGEIVLVNAQAEALFHYVREQLVGRPVEILLPERFGEGHAEHRLAYLADPRTRPMGIGLELAGRRRDGTEFPVDVSLSTIETDEGRLLTAFVRDVTHRDEHAALEEDLAERRALLAHLVTAAEEERRRIAGDIHDDSIQVITAAGMRLQILRRSLHDPEQLRLLAELEQTVKLSISRLRHLLFELRPPALDNEGLSVALELYLEETERQTTSATRYHLDDRLLTQPGEATRVILYRIVQEALANVRKHAKAANATVLLDERDGGFLVRVVDDGVGFAPESARPAPGHLGLATMRERAKLAGGRVLVQAHEGSGTTVEVWIPALPNETAAPQEQRDAAAARPPSS